MVRLAFTGDVMLGRLMNEAAAVNGPEYFWGDTLPVLKEADLRLINLECVVSDKGSEWTKTPKVFHFRALPWALETLKAAKIDYVSLANNHTLDFNEEAMLDMLGRLHSAGIAHAGAGKNLEEARQPAILESGGLRFGVISASDNESAWLAGKNKPGINFIPTLMRPEVLENAARQIKTARERSDVVVFSDHWGPNMRQRPVSLFVSFARQLMELGADIFHGHSAHLFQGIELWEKKPILFDTGDFVDDYAVDTELRNDWSFIFMLDVSRKYKRVEKITLVPTYIERFQAHLAPDFLAELIRERMRVLCGEMGTAVAREGRNLVIHL
jgi:poly-gamma-glutamate synthesis protein (capsule biosynthesis protein)